MRHLHHDLISNNMPPLTQCHVVICDCIELKYIKIDHQPVNRLEHTMDRLMYINSEVQSIDVGFTMKIFKSIHVVQSHHIHVIIIYGFSKNKNKPKTKTPKMQDMKFIDDLNTTNLNSKIYKIIRVNPIKRVF